MEKTQRLDAGRIEVMDAAMAELLRRKTPAERIAIGFGLTRAARQMLASHLRASHPDWPEDQILREVASRLSHGAG